MSQIITVFFALCFVLPSAHADKAKGLELWKGRAEKEKLLAALSEFEKDKDDFKALVYLSRGYYLLGDGHTQDEDDKKKYFKKGREFGESALSLNEEYKKEGRLKALTEKDVPALYWTAVNLGKWARLEGVTKALKYKSDIVAMIERVEKLDPDFFYGAVPRYWGSYYAVAPFFAGGDMDKSKKNFKKSLEMAPEYLGTRVLYAELYWAKEGEKDRFKEELNKVIASDQDQHPELGPENFLEKKKAERLLKNIAEIF